MTIEEQLRDAYRKNHDPSFDLAIRRLSDLLAVYQRFHKKAGCPGRPECYVCAEEEWVETVGTLPPRERSAVELAAKHLNEDLTRSFGRGIVSVGAGDNEIHCYVHRKVYGTDNIGDSYLGFPVKTTFVGKIRPC